MTTSDLRLIVAPSFFFLKSIYLFLAVLGLHAARMKFL